MYYLTYKTLTGDVTGSFGEDEDAALEAYDRYAALYKFVVLTRDETVTNTVVIRDSSLT